MRMEEGWGAQAREQRGREGESVATGFQLVYIYKPFDRPTSGHMQSSSSEQLMAYRLQ